MKRAVLLLLSLAAGCADAQAQGVTTVPGWNAPDDGGSIWIADEHGGGHRYEQDQRLQWCGSDCTCGDPALSDAELPDGGAATVYIKPAVPTECSCRTVRLCTAVPVRSYHACPCATFPSNITIIPSTATY